MTKKKKEFPQVIETDFGETVVKYIHWRKAKKIHKCLFCKKSTDIYEHHVLLLPIDFTGARRYAHLECYRDNANSKSIEMHPEASYMKPPYYSDMP